MADKKLPFFERDDDSDVTDAVAGIADLATLAEGVLVIQKYALSLSAYLIENGESVQWVATDPLGRHTGQGYTPMGAALMWDYNRQDVEGKDPDDDKPRLRLVRSENKP